MNKLKLFSKIYIKIILIIAIIIGVFSIFQYEKYIDINVITFKDENFERLVRSTINKPKGHILKKDLENTKKLYANFGSPLANLNAHIDFKITNLDGIQYFKNLETVLLSGNNIKDISPLSNLSKLEYLDISSMKELTDISPLSKLTKLEYLDAVDNKIKDVSPLSTIPNIKTLELSINEIEDISSLNKLSSLRNLHLGANKIKDVRPLSNMIGLKELSLEKNPIDDFSPLNGLKSLKITKQLL